MRWYSLNPISVSPNMWLVLVVVLAGLLVLLLLLLLWWKPDRRPTPNFGQKCRSFGGY